MRTILYTMLALMLVGLSTVPGVAAEDVDDGEICHGPVCVTLCLSMTGCIDPTDPWGTVRDLIGPCTCDPVD